MNSISFDPGEKTFLLTLRSSFYALRITECGKIVHLGSGPLPQGTSHFKSVRAADSYDLPEINWNKQTSPYEYASFGDISYHEAAIQVEFSELALPLAPGESFQGTVRDLRPRYVSHNMSDRGEPGFSAKHSLGSEDSSPRPTLRICLRDEVYAFDLDLFYRTNFEEDILERWVEIRNDTAATVQVERLDFACLALPVNTTQLTYFSGAWAREFGVQKQVLGPGLFCLEQSGLNTGHGHNPFFLLNALGGATEETGAVWFGALAYSGNWSLRFEHLPTGHVRVFGGYGSRDFGLSLAPGSSHRTPAMVIGCSAEGIGGASRRMHRFAQKRILPKTSRSLRPVLYNSWEATLFAVSEESQMALAQIAASLGVELFCVDDGWFGARGSSSAGLGDWQPRPTAFPRGLKPLADEVRSLGMLFGLWVEPEMVNPDSDLYRAHPDWVLHYPGRPRTECRSQLVLDFGRSEVVDHLLARLDGLASEVGIDFFKWDMNRYATEAGSVAGRAIWHEHVRGLYHLMDELRRRHPRLDIQTCSGGGGRVDLGILSRCDQAWPSDNTDAVTRTSIQDGFSLAYPLRTMECWVTHEQNYLTKRASSLEARFDVAMRGVLGIGTPLTELDDDERGRYRTYISFYKKIRPIVQTGDLYRLKTVGRSGASIWLIVSRDRKAAVFSSVILEQPVGRQYGPFILRGLDPDAQYRFSDFTGEEVALCGGTQLMTLGLPDCRGRGSFNAHSRSLTLLLEAE